MVAALFNPFEAMLGLYQAGMKMNETAMHTQSVLAARMPMLWSACLSPFTADYREMQLMVTEKVDAFGKSARRGSKGAGKVKAAIDANARDLGRLSGGAMLGPMDWLTVAERNMSAMMALSALPGAMIGPVHKRVSSNAQRLGKRGG